MRPTASAVWYSGSEKPGFFCSSSASAAACASSPVPYSPSRNALPVSTTSNERRRTRTSASRQACGDASGAESMIRLRRPASSGIGQDGGDRPCRKTSVNAAESAFASGFGTGTKPHPSIFCCFRTGLSARTFSNGWSMRCFISFFATSRTAGTERKSEKSVVVMRCRMLFSGKS